MDPIENNHTESKFSLLVDSLINISTAVIIFSIIYFFAAQPHQVDGGSMLPNFENRDYVLTEKLTQHWNGYNHGDVLVFHYPNAPTRDYIKRVIALPGDEVSIRDGLVYVNNEAIDEPYVRANYTTGHRFLKEGETYTVQEDEVFVMGDNRSESSDSREWGTVPYSLIVGKVFFRYWPLSRFGPVNSY